MKPDCSHSVPHGRGEPAPGQGWQAEGPRTTDPAHRRRFPVPDLRAFLLGSWRVRRRGRIDGPVRGMRLDGVAEFVSDAGNLAFEELGTMEFGAFRGPTSNRLSFRFASAGLAHIHFESGAPFHDLDLSAGFASVRHDCAPDLYVGRYRVWSSDLWTLAWRIDGPRKRQIIASRFTRINDASP